MPKKNEIPNEVLELLREGTITDNLFFLHQSRQLKGNCPLPRDLYMSFNKVMTILGGKWNRGKGGHVFSGSPGDAIADVLESGVVVDTKKELQQFYTPINLAMQMAELLGPCARVLDPEVGQGALAWAVLSAYPETLVDGIEIDPVNVSKLEENQSDRLTVECCDFMTYEPPCLYDGIIMNPPFTAGQDVEHVSRAMTFLKHGGRMVALVSPGFQFRAARKFVEFRERIADCTVVQEDIPAGTFKASGTDVRTVLLVLEPKEALVDA